MSNKLILILLVSLLSLSLNAQSYRSNRRRSQQRNNQNNTRQTSKQQKVEKQQPSDSKKDKKNNTKRQDRDFSRRFDPRKPVLTEAAVKKILEDRIQKPLLERKLAPDIKSSTKEAFLSQSECSSILSEYKNLTQNFELVEVTRVKPEWFTQYGAELEKFQKIADAIYFAIRRSSDEEYEYALLKFQKQQESCLKFLKKPQPRISKEHYYDLVQKNTKIRQQNYLKRLQQEREAAAKRRQENIRLQNEQLKYLKEHPEFFKEHPEFFDEHPNFLKEHPEFQQYFPAARSNPQDKTAAQDTAKKK